MTPLPIDPLLPQVVARLRGCRNLVIIAPPGAGKTTRVPPALIDADLLPPDHRALVMLQPRRVAARASAQRIADERGWRLGEEVGYTIRFERRTSARTRIRVATEGVLTRQLLLHPFLEGVGAVILDEFHERSLHTDLALALLREIQQTVRDDLMLIVMSATLDAEPVSRFLGDCPIVRSEGRLYPVETIYRPETHPTSADAIESAIDEALKTSDAGDLLVFLPGAEEIRRAAHRLAPKAERESLLVLPLHGALPSEEQDRALRPSDRRKVVLATNLAETSLTIDGVKTVIDSGRARFASFDPERGLDRLELGRISRASAAQRAGRAGRTAPGRCFRLWSEREQRGLAETDLPEVHRVDLCGAALSLHAWGASDLGRFGWYEKPPEARLSAAERVLVMLGALDSGDGRITELGRRLLKIPAHPRLARLLVASAEAGFPREGAALAALLSEKDIVLPEERRGAGGPAPARARGSSDLLVRLDFLDEAERARFSPRLRAHGIDPNAARRAARGRDELIRLAPRLPDGSHRPVAGFEDDALLKALLAAYPDRVTRRRGSEATGLMVGGRGVRLAPESVVREADLFLSIDPREARRGGTLEAHVRIASAVQVEWLENLFPDSVRREQSVRFDPDRLRVVGANTLWYRDLMLREDLNAAVDPEEASRVLAVALKPSAAALVRGDASAEAWLARLAFLRSAMPEVACPEFGDAELAEVLAEASAGKRALIELKEGTLLPFLRGRLTHAQNRWLDEQAPESLTVPTGNRIRVYYEPGRPPVLAVRLQELFGWTETPRVAGGRVPVLLHLLGPNFRPVQVTDDLRSFWSTTYFQVRKDLRARYPKHAWPDDPLSARPEAKGGRRRPS